ncbi:MAG: hypothetical protein JSV78_09115 [Phycisphaerales bacterium]|nr:MAG: hypothetical protein JSV78_09115 [Phycisphaerales bacterium]
MKPVSFLSVGMLLVMCSLSPGARAAEPDVLSVIPADTLAAITIRDPAGLDAKLRELGNELGFGSVSLFLLAKGQLQMVEGIDEQGTIAILLVPNVGAPDALHDMVLLMPTTDRAKLLAFLAPEPVEEGYVKVRIKQQDTYVGTRGAFTVLAPRLETAKRVVACKEGMGSQLSQYQRQHVQVADVSVLVNVKALASGSGRADFKRFMSLLGLREKQLGDYKFWQLFARMEPSGATVEVYTERIEGAAQASTDASHEGLLTGLPDEDFVAAVGMAGGTLERRTVYTTEVLLDYLERSQGLDESRRGDLVEAVRKMSSQAARVSQVVSLLPEGPDGLFGLVKLIETRDDPRRLINAIENFVAVLKSGVIVDPVYAKAIERITYRRSAEQVGELPVDHLFMDVAGLKDVDEGMVKKAIGQDGVLVRVGAVDERHLLVTLGGGLKRFEALAAAVREGRSSLAKNAGIMRAAGKLPASRSVEVFVAVDRLAELVKRVARAMDMDVPPITVTKLDEPMSVGLSEVGSAGTLFTVVIPRPVLIEIIKAFVDLAASQVGGQTMP